MNDSANAKQKIIERISNSTSILVTVSQNPSVDELAGALALTMALNKMKKHATAVVSGEIPAAINFLDPKKTFENTVDSLRDFIIALDKEKADHLRYKVEGEVVKIFITPYRTTITSEDLDFSQGDYNVELVLALGVASEQQLDAALEAHGRILHDATVVTLTARDVRSNLGSIDWHENNASSLSEMLVSLLDGMKAEGASLDEQSATALLTGIVSATDRFSNNNTTSRAMTMAAQLMAAGANQQLIAAKLEEAEAISSNQTTGSDNSNQPSKNSNRDGTTDMNEGESTKLDKSSSAKKRKKKKNNQNSGELAIPHGRVGNLDEVGRQVAEENGRDAAQAAEAQLAQHADQSQPSAPSDGRSSSQAHTQPNDQPTTPQEDTNSAPTEPTPTAQPASAGLPSVADLQRDLQQASQAIDESAEALNQPEPTNQNTAPNENANQPALGGTLNATTEQAAEEKRREEQAGRNRTILNHGEYLGDSQPTFNSPINSAASSSEPVVDPFASSPNPGLPEANPTVKLEAPVPASQTQTLADIDTANRQADDARAAVSDALSASEGLSFEAAPAPQFSAPAPVQAPQLSDLPPMPDFSNLPPLPPLPEQPQPLPATQAPVASYDQPAPAPAPAPQPTSPTQFKIPGQ